MKELTEFFEAFPSGDNSPPSTRNWRRRCSEELTTPLLKQIGDANLLGSNPDQKLKKHLRQRATSGDDRCSLFSFWRGEELMAVANWNSEEALADVRLWPVLGFSKEADGGERKRSESLEERGGGERYGLGENLSEIIIRTGAIVDSIAFVTTKPGKFGWTATHRKFGGDSGNAEHKITLQCDEYITNISGTIGEWHTNCDLTKLKIHTNLFQDGHGPYGGGPYTDYLSDFCSRVPSSGRVVGFFGTLENNYVESIGLYVKKDC
ncbi:hypothetical protein SOVF_101390 [Spinacia oleracea]|nr:hypothetical protein SOVF_101390 [Spinacia oleracea]